MLKIRAPLPADMQAIVDGAAPSWEEGGETADTGEGVVDATVETGHESEVD
jgi:hypothetical protein